MKKPYYIIDRQTKEILSATVSFIGICESTFVAEGNKYYRFYSTGSTFFQKEIKSYKPSYLTDSEEMAVKIVQILNGIDELNKCLQNGQKIMAKDRGSKLYVLLYNKNNHINAIVKRSSIKKDDDSNIYSVGEARIELDEDALLTMDFEACDNLYPCMKKRIDLTNVEWVAISQEDYQLIVSEVIKFWTHYAIQKVKNSCKNYNLI